MAVLANLDLGIKHAVDFTTRIGRAHDSQLLLQQSHVSNHHAVIRWTTQGWLLRDLGSTNGTYVDGERVAPGEDYALGVGQRLGFGRPSSDWAVLDVHEPRTCAIPVDDHGDAVYSQGGMLALPSPQNPVCTLYSGPDGRWLQETESGTQIIPDGAIFLGAGRRYVLRTPEAATGTTAAISNQRRCDGSTISSRTRKGNVRASMPSSAAPPTCISQNSAVVR